MVPEEVLELLDDDHVRAVLAAVTETERTAREIVDVVESSRATVYRRLNDLEAAGLVEVGMQFDDDGHHRELYRAVPSQITVSIGSEGVALESVECADPAGSSPCTVGDQ